MTTWTSPPDPDLDRDPAFDPPSAVPTGVNISEAECVECGAVVSLGELYGWPIAGEYDGGEG